MIHKEHRGPKHFDMLPIIRYEMAFVQDSDLQQNAGGCF